MTDTVLYETEGAVVTITLNRPAALNSFDGELRADLAAATAQARKDTAVRAVILTGAGRRLQRRGGFEGRLQDRGRGGTDTE